MHRTRTIACALAAVIVSTARGDAWPAESIASAVNLTAIEGPGVNDFHQDLSGAYWNPQTVILWVCRNGPGGSNSKLWAISQLMDGTYVIDERDGLRGEWTGFGDLEGVMQIPHDDDVVYVIVEGVSLIRAFDVSVYGTASILDEWNIDSLMPTTDCDDGGRRFVMTADDAGANSLFLYQAFEPGCACSADLDDDGSVTFADLLQLIAQWGPCAGCPADLDADGAVGFDDVLVLIEKWGPCP